MAVHETGNNDLVASVDRLPVGFVSVGDVGDFTVFDDDVDLFSDLALIIHRDERACIQYHTMGDTVVLQKVPPSDFAERSHMATHRCHNWVLGVAAFAEVPHTGK